MRKERTRIPEHMNRTFKNGERAKQIPIAFFKWAEIHFKEPRPIDNLVNPELIGTGGQDIIVLVFISGVGIEEAAKCTKHRFSPGNH